MQSKPIIFIVNTEYNWRFENFEAVHDRALSSIINAILQFYSKFAQLR